MIWDLDNTGTGNMMAKLNQSNMCETYMALLPQITLI